MCKYICTYTCNRGGRFRSVCDVYHILPCGFAISGAAQMEPGLHILVAQRGVDLHIEFILFCSNCLLPLLAAFHEIGIGFPTPERTGSALTALSRNMSFSSGAAQASMSGDAAPLVDASQLGFHREMEVDSLPVLAMQARLVFVKSLPEELLWALPHDRTCADALPLLGHNPLYQKLAVAKARANCAC